MYVLRSSASVSHLASIFQQPGLHVSSKDIRGFFSVVKDSPRGDLKIQTSGNSHRKTHFLGHPTLNFEVDNAHHMLGAHNEIFIVPLLNLDKKGTGIARSRYQNKQTERKPTSQQKSQQKLFREKKTSKKVTLPRKIC